MATGCQLLGSKWMNFALGLTDLIREARYWSAPGAATCPWGLGAFLILLAFLFGICCGGCAVGCFLSRGCQRVGVLVARLGAAYLGPVPPSVQQRLAEYRRDL